MTSNLSARHTPGGPGGGVIRISYARRLGRDLYRNASVYLLAVPALIFYAVFCYGPIYGQVIAFKDFSPGLGIFGSPWAGLKHFRAFFESRYVTRLMGNTIMINAYQLAFGFPAPILFALLLNETRSIRFKRSVQTISYMPHFVSVVVVCGIVLDFTQTDGVVNQVIMALGGRAIPFFLMPQWFRPLYTISGIWQGMGWGSIIYIAALTNIDPTLYEAASIDGAHRWHRMWHVSLPGIRSVMIVLLIMQLGQMMSVGFEKIILLYNPMIYDTADVISTFVYRKGLQEMSYSYSSAVGVFNSVINLTLLLIANAVCRRLAEQGLW